MILLFQIIITCVVILWIISSFHYMCGSVGFLYKCSNKKLNVWLTVFITTTAMIITSLVWVYMYEYYPR